MNDHLGGLAIRDLLKIDIGLNGATINEKMLEFWKLVREVKGVFNSGRTCALVLSSQIPLCLLLKISKTNTCFSGRRSVRVLMPGTRHAADSVHG